MTLSLKGFLLYLGTWMDGSGRNCRPSSRAIGVDLGLKRTRVFELLAAAEKSGWIRTETRPGRPSERLPAMPDPSAPRADGLPASSEGDPSGLTRRVNGHPAGGTRPPLERTGPVRPCTGPDRNKTGTTGGAPPPDPRGAEHASRTRNEDERELTAVPDHNDTKQVTSRPRVRDMNRPLLAIVDPDREYLIDERQLTLAVAIPPPFADMDRDQQWPVLAAQLTRINSTGATA